MMNRLVLGGAVEALADAGFEPLTHSKLPVNDGAVSFGQAVVGWARRHEAVGVGNGAGTLRRVEEMCLAIPARIVTREENTMANVDIMGVNRTVSLDLVPEAGRGRLRARARGLRTSGDR